MRNRVATPGGHARVDVPVWVRQRVCALIVNTNQKRAMGELGVSVPTLEELSEPHGRILAVTLERVEKRLRELEP